MCISDFLFCLAYAAYLFYPVHFLCISFDFSGTMDLSSSEDEMGPNAMQDEPADAMKDEAEEDMGTMTLETEEGTSIMKFEAEEDMGVMKDEDHDLPVEYADNGLFEINYATGRFRINFASPRSPLSKEENRQWAENTYFVRNVKAMKRVTDVLAKSGFFRGLETGRGSAIVPTSPLIQLLINRESKEGVPIVTTALHQLMALGTVEKMFHAQLLSTPSERFPELQGPKAVRDKVEFLAKRHHAELIKLNVWWVEQTNEFLTSAQVGQINGQGQGPDQKTTSVIIDHWERLAYAYWLRRTNLLEVSIIRFLQLQNASPSHLLMPSIPMEETHRLMQLLPNPKEVVDNCLRELYITVGQIAACSQGAIATPVQGDSYESLMLRCVLVERLERLDPTFAETMKKMQELANVSL